MTDLVEETERALAAQIVENIRNALNALDGISATRRNLIMEIVLADIRSRQLGMLSNWRPTETPHDPRQQ